MAKIALKLINYEVRQNNIFWIISDVTPMKSKELHEDEFNSTSFILLRAEHIRWHGLW